MSLFEDDRIAELEARVDRLSLQVEMLMRHLGFEGAQLEWEPASGGPSSVADEIALLLSRGKKAEAIKVYRQATGASLAAAKEAVEQIAWRR
jgi:ribosomal protein L7/L12